MDFLTGYLATKGLDLILKGIASVLNQGLSEVEKTLLQCYWEAVEAWNVPDETKKAYKSHSSGKLAELQDFLTNPTNGREPKFKELLQLWIEKLRQDRIGLEFLANSHVESIDDRTRNTEFEVANIASKQDSILMQIEGLKGQLVKIPIQSGYSCEYYWKSWASCYSVYSELVDGIVLNGRDELIYQLLSKLSQGGTVYVEATSSTEAMAFVVAALLKHDPERAAVAKVAISSAVYENCLNLGCPIVITDQLEAVSKYPRSSAVVICCVSSAARVMQNCFRLGELQVTKFIEALEQSGISSDYAKQLARESAHDVVYLRKLLEMDEGVLLWEQDQTALQLILDLMLIGRWDESNENDRELVVGLLGCSYNQLSRRLQNLLEMEASPLIKTGTTWSLKSPYYLMLRYWKSLKETFREKMPGLLEWVLEDDDSTVLDAVEANDWNFRSRNTLFSDSLKKGIVESLALCAIMGERKNGTPLTWVEQCISGEYKKLA